ncbi:uracil-DNA glycosylase family protein [Neorickettsia risticii]|uniref:Type-4 uracil-DNA glycosylase n=1 Tax=Neorickettsia risticii (strain Illinois) TaxID=434131 RepID=C6V643_NEORI|nr:uracil-DNA glycosylase [Neorickettsia risticii]ACT69861.1 uracil-DNA glycosylase, family 4 [Neorickettsia risticii str. Illinois]
MILKFYDRLGIGVTTADISSPNQASITRVTGMPIDMKEFTESTACKYKTPERDLTCVTTLDELKTLVSNFEGCQLKNNAKNTVFCDGNPDAKIMLIGEAPGEQEDKLGIPFCGRSGNLLDKMLQAIGLDRTKVYITNAVFWRPPGNRRPTPEEIEICRPFLEHHIRLVLPKLIVLLGSTATSSVLKSQDRISILRNKFYEYKNPFIREGITTTVMFHPSYLLRQPAQKKLAWEDLKLIRSYIDTNGL